MSTDATQTFWRNWLMAVSALIAVVGVVMGVFSVAAVTAFTGFFDPNFGPDAGPDAGDVRFQRYVTGGVAGVLAAWGITIYAITRWSFSHLDRRMLTALTAGILSWFVIDSAAKVVSGAALFVPGKLPMLVPLLILLVRLLAQDQSSTTLPERPERMTSKPSA